MLVPEFNRFKKIKIEIPKLESADNISFTMDNGTFYGQGNDGMIFSLTIDNFMENRIDDVMMFSRVSGKVFLKDASWLDISTAEGQYMRQKHRVTLTGDVKLSDDQGSSAETTEATIDLENTEIRGSAPIRANTQFGTVYGEGFAFTRGDKYIFTGRVQAFIDSDKLN